MKALLHCQVCSEILIGPSVPPGAGRHGPQSDSPGMRPPMVPRRVGPRVVCPHGVPPDVPSRTVLGG